MGYIDLSPSFGAEALRDEEMEKGTFLRDQVESLIAAAEGDWKGAILAGYHTGLRLRDITTAHWESVALAGDGEPFGSLRRRTAKTGAVVVAPFQPEFEKWLWSQPAA